MRLVIRLALRKPLLALVLLLGLSIATYQAVHSYLHPPPRSEIDKPLFTVGDARCVRGLARGQEVVKLGPLPGNFLYGGGMAFASVAEAALFLKREGLAGLGWGVFELSGDRDRDTHLVGGELRTRRSMLIVRQVHPFTSRPQVASQLGSPRRR